MKENNTVATIVVKTQFGYDIIGKKIDIDLNKKNIKLTDKPEDQITIGEYYIKEIPLCLYCNTDNNSEKGISDHFNCDICGSGMCDECFDNGCGTDRHYQDFLDDEENYQLYYDKIIDILGYEPAYLCEICVSNKLN